MKALFSTLDVLTFEGKRTLIQPYLQTAQLVAQAWMLIGIVINSYGTDVPRSSPLRLKLDIIGLGSLLFSMAIFSLLIPFQRIAKKQAKEWDRSQEMLQ